MFDKKMNWGSVTMVLAIAAAGGCASAPPPQSPDQATALTDAQCAAFRHDASVAPVLDGSAVERVDALYTGTQSKSSNPRLQGAVLSVAPIRGVTPEWLERSLECHGAQGLAGQAAYGNSVDPFFLPGAHVTITVRSAGDGFRVELAGATIAEAREIVSRAEAFAHQAGQAVATDLLR